MKKILCIIFAPLLIISIIDYFIKWMLMYDKYKISLLLLVIGLFLFPINFKSINRSSFLFLPILTLIVINTLSYFSEGLYFEKLTYFNILLGSFGFFQYLYVFVTTPSE